MEPRLSPEQLDALVALASLEPRFALTGGAALAGVYLGHRSTRDLDLFFHDEESLGRLPERAVACLRASGFDAHMDERFESFCRVLARRDGEIVVVDLVADPVPTLEPPVAHRIGAALVLVDSVREILANKLCALVGRSELRDLIDLRALLGTSDDLAGPLADAARKDGGFSPIVLAWSLERFPLTKVASAEGLPPAEVESLDAFRQALVSRLVALTAPI